MDNVYLAWFGIEYKLVKILRYLIQFHSKCGRGYKVNLITHSNLLDYLPSIPNNFYSLPYHQQADYVKVNVIYRYGGIWLSSDTLVLDNLDILFNDLFTKIGFFITDGVDGKSLNSSVFGSRKGTPLMEVWKNDIDLLLRGGKRLDWDDLSNNLINKYRYTDLIHDYKIYDGPSTMRPINWTNDESMISGSYERYKNYVRNFQPLIVLSRHVYKVMEEKSIEQILYGHTPLNYFINISYQNIIKVYTRFYETKEYDVGPKSLNEIPFIHRQMVNILNI